MCPVKIEKVVEEIKQELKDKHNISITDEELKKHIQELLDERGIINPLTLKADIMNEVQLAIEKSKAKPEENIQDAGKTTSDSGRSEAGDKAGDKPESNFWDDFVNG